MNEWIAKVNLQKEKLGPLGAWKATRKVERDFFFFFLFLGRQGKVKVKGSNYRE